MAAFAETNAADTLMERVFTYPEREELSIGRFESDVYLRFQIDTKRKNAALKLTPYAFRIEKGEKTYVGECFSHLNYSASGITDYKDVAFFCTHRNMKSLQRIILTNIHFFPYDPCLLKNKILSPFHRRNRKYYKYSLDATFADSTGVYHRVAIKPRFYNTQLISGSVVIAGRTGRIAEADLSLTYDMHHIRIRTQMGESGVLSLLPRTAHIETSFAFLKNAIASRLDVTYHYQKAEVRNDSIDTEPVVGEDRYDLTHLNLLKTDTTLVGYDLSFFEEGRPYPLTPFEDSLYAVALADTLPAPVDTVAKDSRAEALEDFFLDSHYIKITPKGVLRLPPIITPSMIQWSRRSISFQTRIRFNYESINNRVLNATARLGYNFKEKQFYWKLPVSYLFAPSTMGKLEFEIGNGNHIYSSLQADEVRNAMKDRMHYDTLMSIFNRFDFNYYRDFYSKLNVSFEPINGLEITTGVTYHRRTLINWNRTAEISGLMQQYESLAPRLHIQWTPASYYYRKGKRKIQLYSKWPTFSFDYERGIPWFRSSNEYERWEFDAQYKRPLDALQALYLRFGFGFYTQQDAMYFLDYNNFKYNSLPNGWDDEISGNLQLLDARWYNESEYYVRLCTAFESPMLVLSRLPYLSRYIQKERIYCNSIFVNALRPYMELGYGVSTHVLDIALFVGAANGASTSVGAKLVFRLFSDW